jgi:hypothetical protein
MAHSPLSSVRHFVEMKSPVYKHSSERAAAAPCA